MSINKVIISGNLTRDPDLRQTNSGMAVLALGVAVNDRRKNQQGEWEDKPNYIDCTMFGSRAESVSRYLSKGSKVAIAGKLDQQSWEDKDGNRRTKISIIVDDIEFMSKGAGGSNGGASEGYGGGNQGQNRQDDFYASDIPF